MSQQNDAPTSRSSQVPPVSPLQVATASPIVASAAAGPATAAAAASSSSQAAGGDAGGLSISTGTTGTGSNSGGTTAESSRTRRGLDRLSGGLRELGFEVLSRKQRHEREKSSSSSNKSLQQPLSGPVSYNSLEALAV